MTLGVLMSNEYAAQKAEEILSMSDWELAHLVETSLENTDIEIAFELPDLVRQALQPIAYDVLVQRNHILDNESIETFNEKSGVEILRKGWYAKHKN